MIRPSLVTLTVLVPTLATAQSGAKVDAIRAFMGSGLQTAGPDEPGDGNSSQDYCKCMAKQLFADPSGAGGPEDAMALCLPGFGAVVGPAPGD